MMGSEAGMMLMAEEFDFLSDKQILRVMLALSLKGPLHRQDIGKLGLGKPYRIKALLKYLVEEGKIVKVKRSYRPKGRSKPPQTVVYYYVGDEFISCALEETMGLLERSHLAYSDGFKRLRLELKPVL
jgi:hypothetical protein